MLEAIVFLFASLTVLGLNYKFSKDLFYPPTLFSIIWVTVIFSYVVFLTINPESNFIVDIKTLIVFLVGQIFFSISGLATSLYFVKFDKKLPSNYILTFPIDKILTFFLLLMFPFYLKAIIAIAESSKYAKLNFYLALRHEYVNNGVTLGILDYLNTISIFTFALFQYKSNFLSSNPNKSVKTTLFKILVYSISFSFAFLSTGRTYFVLLISLYLAFKAMAKKIKKQHVITGCFVFLLLFIGNSLILGKGSSVEDSFEENVVSVIESFTIYFLGGLYGFDYVIKNETSFGLGENVFRFFIVIANKVMLTDKTPNELVMPFITNPIVSNVYTIYYNYFKDFGYFGVLFNLIWGSLHSFFYLRVKQKSSFLNVYIYALLVYPLVMSFFQDQYMSLLSTWIQLLFFGLIANYFIKEKSI